MKRVPPIMRMRLGLTYAAATCAPAAATTGLCLALARALTLPLRPPACARNTGRGRGKGQWVDTAKSKQLPRAPPAPLWLPPPQGVPCGTAGHSRYPCVRHPAGRSREGKGQGQKNEPTHVVATCNPRPTPGAATAALRLPLAWAVTDPLRAEAPKTAAVVAAVKCRQNEAGSHAVNTCTASAQCLVAQVRRMIR